ncbi:site-2 protease family protein [Trichocoleus sp. FACHB-591]|uniref:site-2 protease family protein n=1 Tax=Trichocoleus sp. FACHB-591 TaxID=2692872 RepID=UPI001686A0E7|nr:site-2 protease family protein [Trichocoleus sp. FACHB-591]MBD2098807.1 site-2 protease family protein [Trichocoleus sp. FACHB-591]
MQAGWRIGSVFGIPLFIDPNWLYVLAFFSILNSENYLKQQSWNPAFAWAAGFMLALLLFTSVLLHELGHSLVAQSQGIKVNSITLFLFGGIASIDQESKTPGKAFQVAVAGPAVSLSLYLLLRAIAHILPTQSVVAVVTADLSRINLVLALFNLIPGLPLDGGQIFKAAVWKATGNRFQGVRWAVRSGQTLGWFAIILGMFVVFLDSDYFISGLWVAFLGWFILRNASAYDRMTDLQEALMQIKAADAMTREFRVVDANLTLRQFADDYLLEVARPPTYFAASEGRYRGMVAADDLRQVERSQWENQALQAVLHPLTAIPAVQESTALIEVINQMETQQLNRITVLSPAGTVAGVIDRGDIVRAVGNKLNIQVSEAAIKRIKEEGSYPPGLPLPAIARTTAESFSLETN